MLWENEYSYPIIFLFSANQNKTDLSPNSSFSTWKFHNIFPIYLWIFWRFYLSCPAVSHNCTATVRFPKRIFFTVKSTPIVALNSGLNRLWQNRWRKQVFPTAESPINTTLNILSGEKSGRGWKERRIGILKKPIKRMWENIHEIHEIKTILRMEYRLNLNQHLEVPKTISKKILWFYFLW